jgi:ubiquitin thioesterase ZRANB1
MSETSNEGNAQKWPCEYCTYENYPSAIKCTMCRALKLNQIIDPTNNQVYSNTAVHNKLSKLSLLQGPGVICQLHVDSDETNASVDGKFWSCSECTYLNEWKLHQCSQCLSGRASSSPGSAAAAAANVAANSLHEQLIPLNLSDDR